MLYNCGLYVMYISFDHTCGTFYYCFHESQHSLVYCQGKYLKTRELCRKVLKYLTWKAIKRCIMMMRKHDDRIYQVMFYNCCLNTTINVSTYNYLFPWEESSLGQIDLQLPESNLQARRVGHDLIPTKFAFAKLR